MRNSFLCLMLMLGTFTVMQARDLVVYFSAQGHTQAVAEEIAKQISVLTAGLTEQHKPRQKVIY